MKKSILILIIAMLSFSGVYAQSLNNYKYVIVPAKFDFLKRADQYKLNSLTKFLLEKEGLNVIMDDASFPKELANNRCLGTVVKVEELNTMFTTKLKLSFLDCNNKLVLETKIGKSKVKDYEKAYNLAMREAINSANINYSYNSSTAPKEIEVVEAEDVVAVAVVADKTIKAVEVPEVAKVEEVANVAAVATTAAVVANEVVKDVPEEEIMVVVEESYLKAVKTSYGYKIINNADNKKAFDLVKTGKKDVYFVNGENAIVYKTETGSWKKEAFSNSKIIVENLDIRF